MFKNKIILVLAPHTDDGELGCGGLISRAIRENAIVHYAAFSTADESVPKNFPSNQLEIEVKAATSSLGILMEHLHIYKFQVRKLNYVRQEILEELIRLRDQVKPDIILLPSRQDIHQDHQTVTQEGIRAFKNNSILGYELVWNNLGFNADFFCTISFQDLDNKIKALNHYCTQVGKSYMEPAFIQSMAKVRGTQVNQEFAEAFEVIRWIF